MARENKVPFPSDRLGQDGYYIFGDFPDFLVAYDQVGSVIRTADNLGAIAERYLLKCAREGTRYIEFMLSPFHSEKNGVPVVEQFDAIQQGITSAFEQTGIRASVIATAVRHSGPDEALRLAEMLSDLAHPLIKGFGLTGNEERFLVSDFAGAFYVARLSGLKCTAHVGEWGSAHDVLEAVELLELDRIGHGLAAVDDPYILAELSDRGTCFEICLSSNLHLNRVPSLQLPPIKQLLEAGCKVALGADDPAFFRTTPHREYALANELFREDVLFGLNQNAIEAAFCESEAKNALLQQLVLASNG